MLWNLIRSFSRPYLGQVGLVILFQVLTTVAILFLPSLNARIIDQGVTVGDTGFIWRTGAIMLGVAAIQLATAVAAVWFAARSAMSMGRDLRKAVFSRVSEFSTHQMHDFGPATLITRGTNDVQQIQMLVLSSLNFIVLAPIMGIGGIIMALREDPGLSWLVWVTIPIMLAFLLIIIRLVMPIFRQMQEAIDAINEILREQITGVRVVRAFVREDYETQRFHEANAHLVKLSLKIGRIFVLMFPIINLLLHGATAAVLWFGAERVDAGLVNVGSLTAFMQYLLQILMAVMMGTFMLMMLPRSVVSARRISEVLDTRPQLHVAENPVVLDNPRGEVTFDNVSFTFPGAAEPILHQLNFTASPGQTTAIIGSTGSGKTTLLNLIPRLQDATEGQVLIDGVPVSELADKSLTKTVGMVPQKAFLFSGTVESNLRFGRPEATDDELWEALRIAQAKDFVEIRGSGDATGLKSPISQGGTNVSGGQRQRLCIARTIVAEPTVYLFDDSFSALDVATDAALRAELAEITRATGATVITVAQRVASIIDADQILVLEKGAIVGKGTHRELLETCQVYQEIVDSQASVEEIA